MRWGGPKQIDESGYHRWFAWHPVKIDDEWVWLEYVRRKWVCDALAPTTCCWCHRNNSMLGW